MTEYTNIKVPKPLMVEVVKIIREKIGLGYRSNHEFCIDAIREKVADINSNHPKEKK